MTVTIEPVVIGLDELQAKLNRLANVGTAIGPALVASGAEIMDWVSTYPAATSANMEKPYPGRWYIRGTGGAYALKKGGYRVVKTSQMMNRRWSIKSELGTTEAVVTIGNSATYAPYVHDDRKQAGFHKARGWRTVQDAVRQFERKIVTRVSAAIDAALR